MTEETAQSIDALKLQNRFMALADIELAGAEPLHTAMQNIAEAASALLPASVGVAVLVHDEETGGLDLAGSTLDEPPSAELLGADGGIARRVLDDGRPVFLDDLVPEGRSAVPGLETDARSRAAVPILGKDRRLGVVLALDARRAAFGPDDQLFLEMLARRAAGAIVGARLIDNSRAAGERSEALAWVANALIGAGNLGDVLQAVVEGVAASLAATRVSLITVDPDREAVLNQVHGGLGPATREQATYPELMAGVSGWVVRERRLAVMRGKSSHAAETREAHARRIGDGFGPTIVAPLAGSGDVVGTMRVMRDADAADFSQAEVNLVLAMANQATVGIDNIRLNEATRRSLRETEALYAFTRALTLAETVPDVLATVAEGAREALRAGSVAVFLVAEKGRVGEAAFAGETSSDVVGSPGNPPALVEEVLEADRPLLWSREVEGVPAVIAAPVRSHQRVIGVIAAVDDGSRPDFGSRHIDVLVALAAQAGTAIDNVRLFEEVQRLAVTDDLTGIHNRRHLFDLAEHEFAQAQRYHRPLAAIMFDLDRFKDVNDHYGHAVGDEVLQGVAQRCRDLIREVDVLGRYGGEEFAVLLPETDLKAALEVAERFRVAVAERPLETSKGAIVVTVSAGVAEIHPGMIDVHSLINRADAAMYFAKRTGRNRVEGG